MKDERQFLQVVVEGTPYRALLDSGAMVTLVGRKIADRYSIRDIEVVPDSCPRISPTGL